MTPVAHLFSASYRGDSTPFIIGAHLVKNLENVKFAKTLQFRTIIDGGGPNHAVFGDNP